MRNPAIHDSDMISIKLQRGYLLLYLWIISQSMYEITEGNMPHSPTRMRRKINSLLFEYSTKINSHRSNVNRKLAEQCSTYGTKNRNHHTQVRFIACVCLCVRLCAYLAAYVWYLILCQSSVSEKDASINGVVFMAMSLSYFSTTRKGNPLNI